jgi:hypothetical protein
MDKHALHTPLAIMLQQTNARVTVEQFLHKGPMSIYEGESNENLKYFFTCDLLNKSGTQVYHFST